MIVIYMLISCSHTFSQNSKKIVTISDSNGAFDYGWVGQLQKMLPNDKIYNTSRPGNTIGFDNLGRPALNTLKNLDGYLESSQDSLGRIDYVVIMLGTNDAKYIFKDRQNEVISNMRVLITRIKNYSFKLDVKPQIILMSPPPYGNDKILEKKYKGGEKRVKHIAKKYNRLAKENNCDFVNVHKEIKHLFKQHSKDGVHLDIEGQKAIAALVFKKIQSLE